MTTLSIDMCDTKQEELEAYRSNAEALLLAGSDAVIKNGTIEHASILMELFLKHARECVFVFCNKLSEGAYGSQVIQTAMRNALERGVRVSIICQHKPESVNLISLMREFPDQAKIVLCHPEDDEFTISQKNNFSVMDRKAFRFEPEHKQTKAFACMNDRHTSGYLHRLFEVMSSKVCGTDIEVTA